MLVHSLGGYLTKLENQEMTCDMIMIYFSESERMSLNKMIIFN